MSVLDRLTAPFFSKTERGIVYHRFANRKLKQLVPSQIKVGEIRRQLLILYAILGLMTFSGISFAGAVTLIIGLHDSAVIEGPYYGFDLHLLYFGELFQMVMMAIIALIFDATIQRTLKA